MKKNLILGMFAAASMLFATSCQNEKLETLESGNEATISFNLGVEDGVATRAISDGTSADLLVYSVYNSDLKLIESIEGSTNGRFEKANAFPSDLKDNVKITLAKGQTYTVVFWAQDADCKAYDTADLTKVGISYDGINNDETRDAFFAAEKFTVSGNAQIDVTLKRPFAQLNVGVTKADWTSAVASEVEIETSSVIVKNVANEINLLSGAVKGSVEAKYTSHDIPSDPEFLEVDVNNDGKIATDGSESFHWISMSYLLIQDGSEETPSVDGRQKALVDVNFTFYPKNGKSPIVLDEGLNSVPVQRNWRTNILGKLLTGDIQFNIVIDPIYDNNHNIVNGVVSTNEIAPGVKYDKTTKTFSVYSAEGLKWIADESNKGDARHDLIAKGGEGGVFSGQTVELVQDIDLKGIDWTPISLLWANAFVGTFNGNGYTISNLYVNHSGYVVENKKFPGSGLFGYVIRDGKVENVVLADADVTGIAYTGAIAGQLYSGTVANCTVRDSKISDIGDWGRAGAITGLMTDGTIEGCKVIDTDVVAFRNVGGLAGVSEDSALKNNTLLNVNVIADFTETNPDAGKEFAGELIGQDASSNTKENNTIDNVTVSILRGQSNVYEVKTADDLFAVAAMINAGKDFGSSTIKLMNDIDLGGKNWTPINLWNPDYAALNIIDGNNFKISNMSVKGESNIGFISNFASSAPLTIKNLTFVNPVVETSGSRAAVIIGRQYGNVTLENVDVTGAVVKTTAEKGIRIGGLVGQSYLHEAASTILTIKNCNVTDSEFTGYHNVAGLVGSLMEYTNRETQWTLEGNTVTDCEFTVTCLGAAAQKYASAFAVEGSSYPHTYWTSNDYFKSKTNNTESGNTFNAKLAVTVESEADLKKALATYADELEITLANDMNLGDQFINAGVKGMKSVTIKGASEDVELTLTNSYLARFVLTDAPVLYLKDLTINGSRPNGTWDVYDVDFTGGSVVMDNVTFTKSVALTAGCKAVLNNVTIKESMNEAYALWISAGGDVTLDGCEISSTHSAGRAIKIADQYVTNPQLTKLKVSNTSFESNKKAAILVTSTAGADITLSNIDITKVADDKTNAVWVDSDRSAYFDKVTVTGGSKVQEQ